LSQQRYEILKKIIETEKTIIIDGEEIDLISAHLLIKVIDTLQIKNKERLFNLNLSMKKLAILGWSTGLSFLKSSSKEVINRLFFAQWEELNTQKTVWLEKDKAISVLAYLLSKTIAQSNKDISLPTSNIDIEEKYRILSAPRKTFLDLQNTREVEDSYQYSQISTTQIFEDDTIGGAVIFGVKESFSVVGLAERLDPENRSKFLSLPIDQMVLISWLIMFQTLEKSSWLMDITVAISNSNTLKISWGNS